MSGKRLDAPGTPEAVWRTWAAPATWPALAPAAAGRALVVSPHPDDETLAVGGTVHLLARTGWQVDVVAVTDGEASHAPVRGRDAAALAALRRAEQDGAVRHLGLEPARIRRLGIADARVDAHVDDLADTLVALLRPGDWLIAPWERDGHRDHDASGRAALRAAATTGARLLRYPLWAWHWMTPRHPLLATWRPLRCDLDAAARAAKRRALDAYASQTSAIDGVVILPPDVLERHRRTWEVLLA